MSQLRGWHRRFFAITCFNWSSYYAMAVIALAEAVAREMQNKR